MEYNQSPVGPNPPTPERGLAGVPSLASPGVTITPAPTPPPSRRYSSRWTLPIVVVVIALGGVVLGGSWLYGRLVTDKQQAASSAQSLPSNTYDVASLPSGLLSFPSSMPTRATTDASLLVNGQLTATGGLVLSPTGQPSRPSVGQVYYDQNTKQPYFYDGTKYISMSSGSAVSSIGGNTGAIAIGAGLTIQGGTLSATPTTGTVSSLQATQGLSVSSASGNVTLRLAQDISPSASPTFQGLTLGSALGIAQGGTGATTVFQARQNLAAAQSGTNADITALTALQTISSAGALTLQGNGSSTIVATNGTNTTTIAFENPLANTILRIPSSLTPGTYDICTTASTCAASGTITGTGTANQLTRWNGTSSVTSSIISDNGSTVTVAGAGVIQGASGLSVTGSAGVQLGTSGAASGKLVFRNNANSNTLTLQAPIVGSSVTLTLPAADGTSGQCLTTNGTGTLTFNTCLSGSGSSGGVADLNGLMGSVAIQNATTGPGTIIIDTASTTQKGLAQFDGTNLTVTSGLVTTAQDITPTSSPTFANLTAGAIGAAGRLYVHSGSASNYTSALQTAGLTASRTITLPDASGTLCFQSSTSCNFAPTTGGTGYIQNQALSPQTANFFIQTAASTSVGAIVRGANGQTADIFQAQQYGGSTRLSVSAEGNTHVYGDLRFNGDANHRIALTASGLTITDSIGIVLPEVKASGAGADSLIVRGISGQTGNLLNVVPFGATSLALEVASSGQVGVGTLGSLQGQLTAITSDPARVAAIFQGATSQTANILQLQNSAGDTLASFSSTGQLTLGRAATSGTAQVGSLTFADGTLSGLGATINTTTLTQNRTYTLPDTSGTICIQNSNTCGFALNSGSGNYIQNSTTLQTAANFNIQSAASTSVVAIMRAATSQTADILQAQSSTGTPLSGIDNAGNLYVTAGQSIKIAGSTSFPSSPTEGQLYYKTDTKQLYIYANNKWQADRSTATLIVAASDSQNKEKADYIGDGTNDQNAINSAITALPASGGMIVLLEGTYNIAATINLNKSNTTVQGQGSGTILKRMYNESAPTSGGVISMYVANLAIRNLAIDGNKAAQNSTNNINIIGNSRYSNITFDSLNVTNSAGYGIAIGWGFLSLGNALSTGVNVTNSKFTANDNSAVYFDRVGGSIAENLFQANGVSSVSTSALAVSSHNGMTITSNQFVSNVGASTTGYTILLGNGSGGIPGSFTNNYIANSTNGGLASGDNWTMTGNTISGVADRGLYMVGKSVFTNNIVKNVGSQGVCMQSTGGGVISNNYFYQNAGGAIGTNSNSYFTITNNKIEDNGGTGGSSGIYSSGPNNVISGNYISDTAGTGYAIFIASGSTSNTISNNTYSGTGATSIQDLGTNTIYSNQLDASGNLFMRGSAGIALNGTATNYSLQNTGSFVQGGLSTPGAPTVAAVGTTGATTWGYKVTAYDGLGETLASTETTIANGNTTLSVTNYNRITPQRVNGAVSYKIYRTTASGTPGTTGLLGTLAGGAANFYFDDTGVAGSGSLPGSNTTGSGSLTGSLTVGTIGQPTSLVVRGEGGTLLYAGSNSTSPCGSFNVCLYGRDSGGNRGAAQIIGAVSGNNVYFGGTGGGQDYSTYIQTSASNVGLIVQGASGQTADLLQAKNSTGTVLAKIDKSGILTVAGATINGTLTVNGHIVTGGTTPTIAAGAAACTTPTVSIVGNDTSGTITVTTGSGCAATGIMATITYASAYGAAPKVSLTPGNLASTDLKYYIDTSSTTINKFDLMTGTTPTDGTQYIWTYSTQQ